MKKKPTPLTKRVIKPKISKTEIKGINAVPKIGSKENKPKFQFLSNQSREILHAAAKKQLKKLENLHWATLPFMTDKTSKGRTAQGAILQEIAKEGRKMETAMNELSQIFAYQFPSERPELEAEKTREIQEKNTRKISVRK